MMSYSRPFLAMIGACAMALSMSTATGASAQACLTANEMREAISANHVVQPVIALRNAREAAPGDVVRIRLCRDDHDLIYVVTTVKKDGRVQRVTVEAVSGKVTVVR
jgi:uncharacterized membrane protein YkoI